jgi:uncharacterized protein YndB with AHSA1/START domain
MTPARFATLDFTRDIAATPATVWRAWTDPALRAAWSMTSPDISVIYLESDTRVGGREVALCRSAGDPEFRVETHWLSLSPPWRSVNTEAVEAEGTTLSASLVTAEIAAAGERARLTVTVQIVSLAERDMSPDYCAGFGAGLDSLAELAGRTMVIERVIAAPAAVVWGAWMNEATLPQWWGPEGFTCRTSRIDLRAGGEWVFDMIGPDGTVYPNHHRYTRVDPERRIDYTLHWGEDGPKHADSTATFEDLGGRTRITLSMTFATQAEHDGARDFGAAELGLQTLGKLARFIGAG